MDKKCMPEVCVKIHYTCFWHYFIFNEIKQKVTSDWNFENREKYKDEAGLKKQRIEAARAIGVAFGNGQQPVTTNITWLH